MMERIAADGTAERVKIASMRRRAAEAGAEIDRSAAHILETVRERGYEAVVKYSLRLDGREPWELTQEDLKQASQRVPPDLLAALQTSAEHIRAYQSKLLEEVTLGPVWWDSPVGGKVGRTIRPLQRVGVYVPGGRAAYPSSVLMNVIPAKVAGVEEVIMVTPPTEHLNDAVLTAAWVAGVDRCIAVGGAQAVAALAYGAGFIPRVDKLVGPGNAYVAAAKRMVYGTVDIDMVAGPSEVLVIADHSANPQWVAADLLSQAEHDPLASAVLLTDCPPLADSVAQEIERQTASLSRKEIISASLRDYGCAIICRNLEECAALANEIAPEHLEIMTEHPYNLLPCIQNAGAVFLGAYSPEPLGDYMAGPDHVLPTSGTARFFSPLSVDAFLKKMSLLDFHQDSLSSVKNQIITLATSESLTAHANSIHVRFTEHQ